MSNLSQRINALFRVQTMDRDALTVNRFVS